MTKIYFMILLSMLIATGFLPQGVANDTAIVEPEKVDYASFRLETIKELEEEVNSEHILLRRDKNLFSDNPGSYFLAFKTDPFDLEPVVTSVDTVTGA